ncbi:MAG: MATE family efflux transporter, partial [Prevotella sp.]|nr:MATE family efflux transporter [Prevotella sp.]
VLKYTILTATIITIIGFIIVHLFPYQCARLFTTDKELIDLSMKAIQINLMAFPIIGVQLVTTGFFQCIGKVKFSIFLALSRQLLFLLPMITILPLFFQLDGVWIAMPSADVVATIVAAIMLVVYLRKLKKRVKNNPA